MKEARQRKTNTVWYHFVVVQNESAQDVYYFELKVTKTLWTQEKLLLPLPTTNYLEEFKLRALFIIIVITRNIFL